MSKLIDEKCKNCGHSPIRLKRKVSVTKKGWSGTFKTCPNCKERMK